MLSKKQINKKFTELSNFSKNFLKMKNKILIKRKRETDIFDGFLFKFLYSQKTKTHDDITKQLNSFKKKNIHRSSYEERLKLIDDKFLLEYYKYLNDKIDELFYKDTNTCFIPIIAYDGSKGTAYATTKNTPIKKNKKNSTITFLNMGFFNVSYNDPSFLKLLEHKNERKGSIDIIKTMNNGKQSIYVSDRGFYGLEHFNSIAKTNNFFVCRTRNNCLLINKNKIDYNVNINTEYLKKIRIINYTINNNKYYLATNLSESLYQTQDIIDMYSKRWSVEEYFKYIKNNMKMDQIKDKNWDSIKSSIYMNFIISKLTYLIFNIYVKKLIKDNNHTLNKTRITKDLFDSFIIRFIYGKNFSNRYLIKFFRDSIIIITTNRGNTNVRVGMFPNTKWYIKSYFKKFIIDEKD